MKRLSVFLPAVLDNRFPGNRVALYAFYPFAALTVWRSWHHLTARDGGAQSIASIPLDTYPGGAAATIVGLFSLWGLSQLLLALIMLAACLRYRAMIPMLWALTFCEYAGRLGVGLYRDIETTGTAPGAAANLPFAIMALVMIGLCLIPKRES